MTQLSTDLHDPDATPYFLWDEPMTVREVHRLLLDATEPVRLRLLAKILREARDTDVWHFTSPGEVARMYDRLAPFLGRRRAFWDFLLGRWRVAGLLRE